MLVVFVGRPLSPNKQTMRFWTVAVVILACLPSAYSWSPMPPRKGGRGGAGGCTTAKTHPLHVGTLGMTESTLRMAESSETPTPATFREAEVLGLRLMQEGNYQEALDAFQKGMKLPGSRPDVIRTKNVSGPSPVGGSTGGTESRQVFTLDEFELQAAHYNMACAHARLQRPQEAVANLKLAFENGFDNYATVRADPDLRTLEGSADFDDLMTRFDDSNKGGGFNPFGFLKK